MAEPDPDTPATRLRRLLAALIHAALLSDEEAGPALEEAAAAQRALLAEPAGLGRLSADGPWTLGKRDAEAPGLREAERRVSLALPASCPLPVEDLLSPALDLAAAARLIRSRAATG